MQIINLTAEAAKRLAESLTTQIERNKDTYRVNIRCGDPSGEPDGWEEFSIHCITQEISSFTSLLSFSIPEHLEEDFDCLMDMALSAAGCNHDEWSENERELYDWISERKYKPNHSG
jgi:hypothetical protein